MRRMLYDLDLLAQVICRRAVFVSCLGPFQNPLTLPRRRLEYCRPTAIRWRSSRPRFCSHPWRSCATSRALGSRRWRGRARRGQHRPRFVEHPFPCPDLSKSVAVQLGCLQFSFRLLRPTLGLVLLALETLLLCLRRLDSGSVSVEVFSETSDPLLLAFCGSGES